MNEIKQISVNGVNYLIDGVNLVEISYNELKNLRDNANLIPGRKYRIIDYSTKTVGETVSSGNNLFDIIVEALETNSLNEAARVCQHNNDSYFTNCNLESWEIKYCLDNDTSRFSWANTTNGKGVIYYMKDDRNNECYYDFKNIKFKGKDDKYHYTFELNINGGIDYSVYASNLATKNSLICSSNKIGIYNSTTGKHSLNHTYISTTEDNKDWGCQGNIFESNTAFIVVSNMSYCYFGPSCSYITANGLSNVSFGNQNKYIEIPEGMDDSSFGSYISKLKFPQYSAGITIGNNNFNRDNYTTLKEEIEGQPLINVYVASGVCHDTGETITIKSGEYSTEVYRDKRGTIQIHQQELENIENSIPSGSITSLKIAEDAIISYHIADNTIRPEHLNTSSVTSEKIADKSINTSHLSDATKNYIENLVSIGSGSSGNSNSLDYGEQIAQYPYIEDEEDLVTNISNPIILGKAGNNFSVCQRFITYGTGKLTESTSTITIPVANSYENVFSISGTYEYWSYDDDTAIGYGGINPSIITLDYDNLTIYIDCSEYINKGADTITLGLGVIYTVDNRYINE